MKFLPLFLILFLISACADPIEVPVAVEIPPQLLAQVDKPSLRGDTAGDVAILLSGMSGALDKANAQLSAIDCLYAKHKAVLAGDPAPEC